LNVPEGALIGVHVLFHRGEQLPADHRKSVVLGFLRDHAHCARILAGVHELAGFAGEHSGEETNRSSNFLLDQVANSAGLFG